MSNAIDRLSHAIDSTLNWLRVHFLKCIPSKTELIHFSSRFSKNLADLQIGSTKIESTNEIRNLGVQMDRHLHMRAQIRKVCRSCSNSLRNIGRIRKFISNADAKRLSEALILSSLDYGNILLSGLPDGELKKLQSILNTTARLVVRAKRSDPIIPIMKELNWLSVKDRVKYKILVNPTKF